MKKTITLFLALILVHSAWAYDFTIGGVYYNITSGSTVEVTYKANAWTPTPEYTGSVTILSTVTYSGTSYNVTAIGGWAFKGCLNLTSVNIPNSVTSIGSDAFGNCTSLTTIDISSSISTIDYQAFSYCTSLVSVIIPNSVTYIGTRAFYGCTSLSSIAISNASVNIRNEAFFNTAWYNNQPDGLIYINNIAYKYKGTMPAGTAITLNTGTIAVANYAFSSCAGLISVTIPNSVSSIGESAFSYCTSLTFITIPNSVASIGSYVFSGCSGLTSVNIPNSVTKIGDYAFNICTGLTSVTIPNSVTTIGSYSFSGCTGLTSIYIPSSVASIGHAAFNDCRKLASIYVSSTTPVDIASTGAVFYNVNTTSCVLHVPVGSISAYRAAYYWRDFTNIVDDAPVLITTALSNITSTTATTGGNITDTGAPTITARGVCWSTTVNPTTANNKTTDGTGVGVFTSSITGLSPAQTYHIRAYATNSITTSYGSDLTFTTLGTAPTITTTTVNNVTTTTATSGGNVTAAGTSSVTARGVCWSTSTNPTIANSKTTDGTGTGAFTSSITGLIPNTTYHIRAYATSSVGTSYGSDLALTTICLAPTSFSLSAPANGGWTTSTPLFQWVTSTGASSYNLYIDGILKKANITSNFYQILSTETINNGMHTWYVEATNGCVTQSNETWSFRVDTTQPAAFSLASPTDNSWTASLQPTLTWGASTDVNSGLAKYQLWIDGVLNRENISTTATSTTPMANLTNGSHTWEIRAVDNVGNVRNSTQKLTVKVDNMPPGTGVSNCLYFDGTGNYVSLNNNLHISNNFTIETWINFSSGGSESPRIISKQNDAWGTPGEYSLYLDGTGSSSKIVFWIGDVSTLASNTILSQNTWYHVAAVYSGNSSSSTMKIYINGVLNVAANTSGTLRNTTDNLTFGRKGAGTSYLDKYKGWIDELRIWNTARSGQEITENKDNIVDPNTAGLIGYWRFNEGSGITIKDNSINNYAGTNYGSQYQSSTLLASSSLCSLKNPTSNQYISSKTPTFSWGKAIDTGIGFEKFQLFIDGNMVKDNLTDSTWTVITPLTYGAHTWYVKGFDLLGNNQSSYSRTFYIDNAKPNAFILTTPTNNQIVNLPTPNLTWQATTDSIGGSGLRKYQLLINGVVNRDSIPTTQTTVAPKNALAQGAYTWYIKAYDNVGNVRQSTQTNTFYVDWENPTDFTLISPLDNSTLTVAKPEFKWHKSTDVGSGISKYELNITGQTPITILQTDTSKTITSNLPNGPYTWYVKAYDVAGGFTSSNTQTFTINAAVSEVEQTELNNSIKVYPNPVGNELVIESAKNERTNFEIINSIGQVIYKGILFDKISVQTGSFNSGIYVIKIGNEKTAYEFKKILKK